VVGRGGLAAGTGADLSGLPARVRPDILVVTLRRRRSAAAQQCGDVQFLAFLLLVERGVDLLV
jgi:hypothetical protein